MAVYIHHDLTIECMHIITSNGGHLYIHVVHVYINVLHVYINGHRLMLLCVYTPNQTIIVYINGHRLMLLCEYFTYTPYQTLNC